MHVGEGEGVCFGEGKGMCVGGGKVMHIGKGRACICILIRARAQFAQKKKI